MTSAAQRSAISISALVLLCGGLLAAAAAAADSLGPDDTLSCGPTADAPAGHCRPDPAPPGTDGAPGCQPPAEGPYRRDWDLSAWLAAHGEVRSALASLSTTQSGQRNPAPFAGVDWSSELLQFRTAFSTILGPLPHLSCVALNPQVVDLGLTAAEQSQIDGASYDMQRVIYRGAHGEPIPAFLLVPRHIVGKVAAVLVMHQALPACGKKEPAGVCLTGTPWLDFARDLAQQGFVTLAPDTIGFGERSQLFGMYGMEYPDAAPLLSRFPGASLMGLIISDAQRGLDYLQTLPYVDSRRIGMIGHSSGAIATLFTAALDPRVRCAVTNGAPNLIRRETLSFFGLKPGISRWAGFGYLPALGFYDDDVSRLPIEMHQLYAMIAPRGLFVSLMEDDTIAPAFDRIQFAMDQTQRAFAAQGGDFMYHTVTTGLTPERHREWAAPMCLAEQYDVCSRSGSPTCLAAFDSIGMTAACIALRGSPTQCAHRIWMDCLAAPHSESDCQLRFASAGVNDSCVEHAFQTYLRRDHGWYPETESLAYPWLTSCLRR